MSLRALPTAVTVLFAAASTPALSAPAVAQFSPQWSKTEAILGAPSALQAILAQQSGLTPPPVALPAPLSAQPASYALPRPTPSVALVGRQQPPSPGVLNGRPDVFGTVALRVDHTPLDSRWRAVESSPVTGTAARFARAQRVRDVVGRLEAINWYVNKRIRYVDDQQQYRRADVWSTADESLNRRKGDCEDYAIAKLQMLRRAGLADRDLYLVILKDLVRRADHAVLVARANGHMYVLDNGTDELLDSENVSDYRPMLTFAAAGAWTHGYRIQPRQVNIASAEVASPGIRLGLR